MSGPVWRLESGKDISCDECLSASERVYVLGQVVDAEFLSDRRLCEPCYTRNISLIAADDTSQPH
jgi:hypothetical protein